jgi:hypothetical protein
MITHEIQTAFPTPQIDRKQLKTGFIIEVEKPCKQGKSRKYDTNGISRFVD